MNKKLKSNENINNKYSNEKVLNNNNIIKIHFDENKIGESEENKKLAGNSYGEIEYHLCLKDALKETLEDNEKVN